MTTLTIRNIDPVLKERLRACAASHGRSMEAEMRHILSEALATGREKRPNLADAIHRRFARLGGVALDALPPQPIPEPPSFER